ncbi:MAG: DUF3857 and transglutaminase domain-containing protein [Acidobacteriales bacterium]|nr:DUF3857 and transglutaminase domain-containing protein [Terriglobales bacterium]
MRLPTLLLAGVFASLPFLYAQPIPSFDSDWLPITDAERQQKTAKVEKDAGAEALFWRVRIHDDVANGKVRRILYNYIRLKIFDEKGKETASAIELPFASSSSIINIAGRTVRPNGDIVELKRDAVHERDVVRGRGMKRRAKTFAMPGVEPGAIVEYRWVEVQAVRSGYIRLQFQREIPIQKVTYFLRPVSKVWVNANMGVAFFNCKPSPLKEDVREFHSTTLENIAAFKEEPMMPGEPNVRPWALVFYSTTDRSDPDKYWNKMGKDNYAWMRALMKASGEVKQATQTAVAGATTEQDKVVALIRYIRKNLRGLYDSNVSDAERGPILQELNKNGLRPVAKVLKSGIGSDGELNALFATMASQAGLEARPAWAADTTDLVFSPRIAEDYFLNTLVMAVKIGDAWKVYDVSTRELPAGMVSWRNEGVMALVSDPKSPHFIQIPTSEPEVSTIERNAVVSLTEDGTLRGQIRHTYTGHEALDIRQDLIHESEARRVELLKDDLVKEYPNSEITEVKLADVDDTDKPVVATFSVKVANYAERTGKRLFLNPLVARKGSSPIFASAERHHEIEFPYAWREVDKVVIRFPEGYALESAENPGSIDFGKPGSYSLQMGLSKDGALVCRRELIFGRNAMLHFPVQSYKDVKTVFDEIHRRDTHTLALRRQTPSNPTGGRK